MADCVDHYSNVLKKDRKNSFKKLPRAKLLHPEKATTDILIELLAAVFKTCLYGEDPLEDEKNNYYLHMKRKGTKRL